MERVRPGVAVEENNLTQNVSALRKALGERREAPHYILIVPGLGYRFIADVSESRPGEADSKPPPLNESFNDADKSEAGRDELDAPAVEAGAQAAVEN